MTKKRKNWVFIGEVGEYKLYVTPNGSVRAVKVGTDPKKLVPKKREALNQNNFGLATKLASYFNSVIGPFKDAASDKRVNSQFNKLFRVLLKQDNSSKLGEHSIEKALADPASRIILRDFKFSERVNIDNNLYSVYTFNKKDGSLEFKNFNPERSIQRPKNATHACIEMANVWIDFAKQDSMVTVDEKTMLIDDTIHNFTIKPKAIRRKEGYLFQLLKIRFLDSHNGKLYPLNNQSFNSMKFLV